MKKAISHQQSAISFATSELKADCWQLTANL
jgi:hypothetical protein